MDYRERATHQQQRSTVCYHRHTCGTQTILTAQHLGQAQHGDHGARRRTTYRAPPAARPPPAARHPPPAHRRTDTSDATIVQSTAQELYGIRTTNIEDPHMFRWSNDAKRKQNATICIDRKRRRGRALEHRQHELPSQAFCQRVLRSPPSLALCRSTRQKLRQSYYSCHSYRT